MRIVIATPYPRFDRLEDFCRSELRATVLRLRTRDELAQHVLRELQPRYVFFPHWSWKIPAEVHENFECVIFHMTDVPYGRGGSPLQNLIVRGSQETMLTALRCVEGLDAGPVYMKRLLLLHGTAEEIFMRAATIMEEMIEAMVRDQPEPQPQIGEPVHFHRRRPEDGDLSNLNSLGQVYDYIRMLDADGYPNAFIETPNFRFEFNRASLKPGEVIADVRIRKK